MKWYKAKIKITLLAGKAAPSPALGQALGQYGLNIMVFCKEFNSLTNQYKSGLSIPVILYIDWSNNAKILLKAPPTMLHLKFCCGKAHTRPTLFVENMFQIAHFLYGVAPTAQAMSVKKLYSCLLGTSKSSRLVIRF